MFGLFAPPPVEHPALGTLHWKRGHWRGTLSLPGAPATALILQGGKRGPDDATLAEAMTVAQAFAGWQAQLGTALFEHSEPYAEAGDDADGAGNGDGAATPPPGDAGEALRQARLLAVVIAPLDGQPSTELCLSVPWDEDHTLGARFRAGQWVELCGSTLVP